MTFNPLLTNHSNTRSILDTVRRGDCDRLAALLGAQTPWKRDAADMAHGLAIAAETGQFRCASILLEAGALPNIHDASGCTPLIIAAKRGHAAVLKLLVDAGSKIDKATFHIRATALHWASTNGHFECTRILLDAEANTSATTIHGRTPLMMAARSDEENIVQLLLERGASVNAQDFEGATALHLAAEEGADSCCCLLLKAGASINARMKNDDTPLVCAARRGQEDVVRILVRRASLDLATRSRHLAAIHWAAVGGCQECVETILAAGDDVNAATLEGHFSGTMVVHAGTTPIMLAAERGHQEAIQALLVSGASVDACDEEGQTALLYAIRKRKYDCVRVLLDEGGADPDGIWADRLQDTDEDEPVQDRGYSPIFQAIRLNDLVTVKLLLHANCNLEILGRLADGAYVTPLAFALMERQWQIARMLLLGGSRADFVSRLLAEEALLLYSQEGTAELQELVELLRTPPSLQQMARNAIRQRLGRRAWRIADDPRLPLMLKRYINLSDLED